MRQLRHSFAPGISIGIVWLSFHWLSQWGAAHQLPAPGLFSLIVQGQLGVLLSIFGHELGHLLAGLVSGEMPRSFRAGPFRWELLNGRFSFDFDLRKFYSGAVSMVQPDLKTMRSRKAFSIMGGPAASLLLGSVCVVGALTAAGNSWEPFWMLLTMIGSCSLAAVFANLIPQKPEGAYADGAQLYQIVTNGPWAKVHLAFAMISTSAATQARPREFDIDVIEDAAAIVSEGERGLLLRLAAAEHYLDAGQVSAALVSMRAAERLYDECTFDHPENLCAGFAFVNAFYKRDLATAELWWDRIESIRSVEIGADYWRAWTALLWLKGEKEEAREALHYGTDLAMRLPASGMHDFMRSCFENLREALEEESRVTESLGALAAAIVPSHAAAEA
ncbi:MAG: hypothetical protein ABSF22_00620 [Bryobacteraceae bacterium]